MRDPAWPLLDLALARRLEGTEAESGLAYARARRSLTPEILGDGEPIAGGLAVFAGPTSRRSRAIGLGLHGPVDDGELDRLEAFYAHFDVPPTVEVCPLADESLPKKLGERGYRLEGFDQVWIRSLSPDEPFAPPAHELSVTRAEPGEAELWSTTVTQGVTGDDAIPAHATGLGAPLFLLPSASLWFGRWRGEPVGGAAMTLAGGLATLFATGTRVHARGRGVQSALLAARLAFAADAGCDLATVTTAQASVSQRNVERHGFRVAYTKVEMRRR